MKKERENKGMFIRRITIKVFIVKVTGKLHEGGLNGTDDEMPVTLHILLCVLLRIPKYITEAPDRLWQQY